jgi:Ca2+-binding EF-hand superfamily protein
MNSGETKNSGGPPPILAATKKSSSKKPASSSQKKGGLSAAQQDEIKECFAMFDRDSDGYIVVKEIGVLMMSLGLSPTREELQTVMKKIRPSKKGHVSLPEFLEIVKSNSRKVSSGSEILEGFKIYDQMMSREKDNGKISVKELRQVMTTFGEKLNSDEVDGMVTFADDCTFNGNIDYTSFVDKMMNPNKHRKKPAI